MSHLCDGRDPSCPACAPIRRRLDSVRAAMTVDDELDDIKRARIWSQLEDRLAVAAPPPAFRRSIAFAVAAVAGAAAVVLILRAPHRDAPDLLAVPVDTTVTSQLGPHTAASITGPAQLDLLGPAGDATAVRLRSGTLLAEFAGGAGRSLRIEAPGAVIEVVGTLFAVEVRGRTTCTSVAHGRVRVTASGGAVEVGDGQRYCVGAAVAAIADDMRAALARHDAALAASAAGAAPASPGDRAAAPGARSTAPPVPPRDALAPAPPPANRSAPQAPPPGGDRPPAVATQPSRATAPSRLPPRRASADRATAGRPASPVAAPPTPPRGIAAVPDLARVTRAPRRLDTPSADAAPAAPTSRPPPVHEPTADELYRIAETALAARDPGAADAALARLVAGYPASQLVDQALYDRARIAYQQRAWPAARAHLARLAALPSSLLAEPGHYLRCRIAIEARDASAAACLIAYRAAFPRSPHDLDVLALLVQLAHAKSGCAGAAPLVDELAQSYPRTTLAAAWRARCPEVR